MTARPRGSRAATLRDVAAAAQVSISTASRVLGGRPYVRAQVATRVLAAAAELSYRTNEAARGLRSSRTMTLGVVCHQLRHLPMIEFLDGFAAGAEEAGYAVLVGNARGSEQQVRALIGRFFERRVDGLLVESLGDVGDALHPFIETGVPVVMSPSRGTTEADVPLIMTSEAAAVRAALARLVELGHQSFAYFGTLNTVHTPRPSYVTQAAAQIGIACTLSFLPDSTDAEAMARHLALVLEPATAATAVAVNHSLLGPFVNAVRLLGLTIPADVSAVSFSDYWAVDTLLDPPLASIHSDAVAMGKRSAEILLHWVRTGEAPPRVTDLNLSSWVETPSIGPRKGTT